MKKRNILIIIIIIIIVFSVGIGYSYLNQSLTVQGKITVDATSLHNKMKLTDSNFDGDVSVGEIITIGTERFYVISNDGTNVKALAEYNLLVGNTCTSSLSSSCTALTNPTGLQDSTALGYHYKSGTTTVDYPKNGVISFSSSTYWDEEDGVTIDLTNSTNNINPYLIAYKASLKKIGGKINDVSLITKAELISLGCDESTNSCKSAPSWVYKTTYWSRSVYGSTAAWSVDVGNNFQGFYYSSGEDNGIRPVITINKSDLVIEEPEKNEILTDSNSNNTADVGEIITIGTERFYVISNDGTNVKAIAEWNLFVGKRCTSSSCSNLTRPTGLQDETAIGYKTSGYPYIGTVAFSSTNYWKETDEIDLTNSTNTINPYLIAYKTSLINLGAKISDISLITKPELISLGCSADDYTCEDASSWVYQTTYWTRSTNFNVDNKSVWLVFSDCSFDSDSYTTDNGVGIRPVITLNASDIKVS